MTFSIYRLLRPDGHLLYLRGGNKTKYCRDYNPRLWLGGVT